MFIKRTEFDEMQKKLAEYRDTNYELQLENETLRDYIRYRDNMAETKVVRKDGKTLLDLWLKSETLKRLRMLAHKQPEAFLSQEEEIATYIEKLIDVRPTTWSSEDRFGNILRDGWKKNEKL